MKRILVFILLSLLIVACKKKSTVHITARNAVTGEPYAGLSYNIERSVSGSFENHYKTVASGVLDENGEAVITKRFSKNWSHEVSIGSPDNTCYSNNNSFYFSGGENIDCDFKFAECAYMKLKIENVNCQGANDKIILYQGNQVGSFNYSQPWEHDGCALWESNGYSDIPMGEQYYKWEVTRNNVTTTYYDTLYLNAGEYKTYDINY